MCGAGQTKSKPAPVGVVVKCTWRFKNTSYLALLFKNWTNKKRRFWRRVQPEIINQQLLWWIWLPTLKVFRAPVKLRFPSSSAWTGVTYGVTDRGLGATTSITWSSISAKAMRREVQCIKSGCCCAEPTNPKNTRATCSSLQPTRSWHAMNLAKCIIYLYLLFELWYSGVVESICLGYAWRKNDITALVHCSCYIEKTK